jgi:hypothetical protein
MIPQIKGFDYSLSAHFDYSNLQTQTVKYLKIISVENNKILEDTNDSTPNLLYSKTVVVDIRN